MKNGKQITRGITVLLAVATGFSVANIYYNQPLLGLMAQSFGGVAGNSASVYFVAGATLLGFTLGIVLLVPLGDRVDRRVLILWQMGGLVLSLIAVALAPSAFLLILASIAVGVSATIAQQFIPLAAELAPSAERGRVVGMVQGGLLAGILLARTLSGFVGKYYGWRVVYLLGAVIIVIVAVMLAINLPHRKPAKSLSYKDLMLSLIELLRTYPQLRGAIVLQGALFAAFNAFWGTLALLLKGAPYYLGSDVAGLFGILGLAGILGAPLAGRIIDKRGPNGIISLGTALVLAAFVLFAVFPTILGLSLGVVLLDLGVQTAMVANQAVIFTLKPDAQSRVNTLYMTGLFLAGTLGSTGGSAAWNTSGWMGVASLGLVLAAVALLIHRLFKQYSQSARQAEAESTMPSVQQAEEKQDLMATGCTHTTNTKQQPE